jgi:hypothetical protein
LITRFILYPLLYACGAQKTVRFDSHVSRKMTSSLTLFKPFVSSSYSSRRFARTTRRIHRRVFTTRTKAVVKTDDDDAEKKSEREMTMNGGVPPEEQPKTNRGVPGMTVLEKDDSDDDDRPMMGSSFPELDYLQELIAIQKDCPKEIGFFGTRNMGFLHQQLIEILAYALCLTGNHIFTSGATGTNAAVIRGSLRAERPELLTVVLPQSLSKQPAESRELLEKVSQVEECPENDHLPLLEASRICNDVIVSKVRQVICFAFHDSTLLLDTCREAKVQRRMVTLFYLD